MSALSQSRDVEELSRSRLPQLLLQGARAEIKAFRINPPAALVLAVGTWHAGPLYKSQVARNFYNLELSDTNVNDRHIRDLHFPHLVPIRVEEEESSQQG